MENVLFDTSPQLLSTDVRSRAVGCGVGSVMATLSLHSVDSIQVLSLFIRLSGTSPYSQSIHSINLHYFLLFCPGRHIQKLYINDFFQKILQNISNIAEISYLCSLRCAFTPVKPPSHIHHVIIKPGCEQHAVNAAPTAPGGSIKVQAGMHLEILNKQLIGYSTRAFCKHTQSNQYRAHQT